MTVDPAKIVGFIYRIRVILLCGILFGIMSWLVPGPFATWSNQGNILRAASTDALAAVGFTVVLLAGHLDLSVGAVMTLGGTVVMFLAGPLGWTGALLAAIGAGVAVGLFNGLLVTRAKINAFIVTLGTLTILTGLTRILLEGGSKSAGDVAAGMAMVEWLGPVMPWSPRVLLVFGPVIVVELFLRRCRGGRNLYLIGGNRDAAWTAGIAVDRHVLGAFVLAGALSAPGGRDHGPWPRTRPCPTWATARSCSSWPRPSWGARP